VVSAPAVSAIAPVAPVTALPAMSESVFAALAYGMWVEVIVPAIVAPLTLHVGQEIVPVVVIGLGVTTMGDEAATLVTLPVPLPAKFVSFGANAFSAVVRLTGELPLIVVPVLV
jgi:hypothetical protein